MTQLGGLDCLPCLWADTTTITMAMKDFAIGVKALVASTSRVYGVKVDA